jgi:hypothetical protein
MLIIHNGVSKSYQLGLFPYLGAFKEEIYSPKYFISKLIMSDCCKSITHERKGLRKSKKFKVLTDRTM